MYQGSSMKSEVYDRISAISICCQSQITLKQNQSEHIFLYPVEIKTTLIKEGRLIQIPMGEKFIWERAF